MAVYRWMLLLAALGVLFIPLVLQQVYAEYLNPLVPWIAFVVVPLFVLAGTYLSRRVRQHVWLITSSYAYALTAYVAWLSAFNRLDDASTLVVCATVVAAGFLISIRVDRTWRLAVYLAGLVLVAVLPVFLVTPAPAISLGLYAGYLVLITAVLYLAGLARVRPLQKLRRSRDEVAEQEHLLRTVLDTIPDPIFIIDREGRYCMANEAGVQGTQVSSPDEVVGKTAYDLFPPETAEEVRQSDMALMEQGEDLVNYEHAFEMPTGEKRVLSSTRVLLRDEEGRVNGLVGITHDVSEQKKREAALREAKEAAEEREQELAEQRRLLRTIIDTIPDPIFMIDREGRYRIANGAVLPPGVTDAEEIAGKTVFDFFQAETAAQLHEIDQTIMETGEGVYNSERTVVKADGERLVLSVTKIPFHGEHGDVVGLVGTARDITSQKEREQVLRQAKEEAEAAARTKSEILNNMSHELRTPLASILGFAGVLQEESEGQQEEFARRIARSGERLRQTLDSVLDLAQLEADGKNLEWRRVDVAQLARETADFFRPQAEEKGLDLEVKTSGPSEAVAHLDEGALQRILTNLLSNAVKFTEEGSVTISVEADPETTEAGAVRLRVEDTGIGISEAFLPNLFEDFKQESTGLSRTHEGSGLGLAITKRLVALMDGTIRVGSTRGEGSCFTVTFPRNPSGEEISTGSSSTGKQAFSASEERISAALPERYMLVVEDNPSMRRLAEHVLQHVGVVETARGFDEAVAAARRRSQGQRTPYDLLLIDIDLGEAPSGEGARNGLHLLRKLREELGYAEVPAVALTAYAMPSDEERFLEAGFDDYLAKPFKRKELVQLVETLSSVRVEEGVASDC